MRTLGVEFRLVAVAVEIGSLCLCFLVLCSGFTGCLGKSEEEKREAVTCEGRFPKYIEFICPLTCRSGQCRTTLNGGQYKPYCICLKPEEQVGLQDADGQNYYNTTCRTVQEGVSQKVVWGPQLRINDQLCLELCRDYRTTYSCEGQGRSTGGRAFGPVTYCTCKSDFFPGPFPEDPVFRSEPPPQPVYQPPVNATDLQPENTGDYASGNPPPFQKQSPPPECSQESSYCSKT